MAISDAELQVPEIRVSYLDDPASNRMAGTHFDLSKPYLFSADSEKAYRISMTSVDELMDFMTLSDRGLLSVKDL